MIETTVIRNADWIIGWDAEAQSHVYLRNADLAFTGKIINFVGRNYQGASDHQLDGKGLMVMPGFVNIHAHPGEDTYGMGLNDGFDAGEEGERAFYELLKSPRRRIKDMDLRPLSAEVGYAELLLSGVTTLVDISESSSFPGWIELLERSGLRAYLAPAFPSFTSEQDLEHQLARALSIIDEARANSTGRLSGVVLPFDVVTVPGDLLRTSLSEARKRDIPWMIHAAEALLEINDVVEEHGLTPIQLLEQLGLLEPGSILAHAVYFDHHPALENEAPYKDMRIVAQSGASVAHAPYGFALSCMAMRGFGRYREAGINVGLGTDTFGHNMLEEMRLAMLISRVTSGRVKGSTAADIFHAATVGGAQALQRDDIGRLVRNAKADLVLVDLNHPAMQPVNDPLRSLILRAGERAVRDVYIDGERVVEKGQVMTLDYVRASKKLGEAMRGTRTEAANREEEEGPPDEGSAFAIPLRRGLTVGARLIVNRREVLYSRIEDVPYEHWTPNYDARLWERPVVPYGMSATLDVAVSKMEPGCELDYRGKRNSTFDWYVQGLSGVGIVEIDGNLTEVHPGTIVLLPAGTSYTIANRSHADWIWYSIHPNLDYQYRAIDEESRKREFARMWEEARALEPGPVIYATIADTSLREVPGSAGFSEGQLVLSKDFNVSLRSLREGTELRAPGPLQYDLYLHGVQGMGVLEIEGRKLEFGADMFAFLPESTHYSLFNPSTASWDFIWMRGSENNG